MGWGSRIIQWKQWKLRDPPSKIIPFAYVFSGVGQAATFSIRLHAQLVNDVLESCIHT